MSLTDAEVRKLALLARLDLSDDEVSSVRPQLDSILAFVKQLSELDTTDVEPMTTALDVDNRWREDQQLEGLTNDESFGKCTFAKRGLFSCAARFRSCGLQEVVAFAWPDCITAGDLF